MGIGYIYLITNLINGKKYVGQTRTSVQERWYRHCCRANTEKAIGIDGAIKKYGAENFSCETIKECPIEELDKWEIYYIKEYKTYQGDNADIGYNLTLGGQGGLLFDIDETEMLEMYNNGKTAKEIGEYYHCSDKTIGSRLKKYNIDTKTHQKQWLKNHQEYWTDNLNKGKENNKGWFKEGDGTKPVYIVELDKAFPSLKECSQWLFDNGYSTASSWEAVRKGLSRCLTQNRKTYLKLHFKYL